MKKKAETTRLKSTSDGRSHSRSRGPFSSIRQVYKDYKLGREIRRRERQDQGRNRSEAQEQEVNRDLVSSSSKTGSADEEEKVTFVGEVVQDLKRDQEHQHQHQHEQQENERPKSEHSGDDGGREDVEANAGATNTPLTTSRPVTAPFRTPRAESTTATSASDYSSTSSSSYSSAFTLNRRKKNPWCTDGNYGETQRYIQARYRETRSWHSEPRFPSSEPVSFSYLVANSTKSPSALIQPEQPLIRPTTTTTTLKSYFLSPRLSWKKQG